MLKKLLLVLCMVVVFPLITFADNDEIDYQTYCKAEEVVINKNTDENNLCTSYTLTDNNGKELSYVFLPSMEFKQASTNISLRKTPTTIYDRVAVVEKGTGILQLASCEEGWSLIWLNSKYYFVWSEYLIEKDDDTKIELKIKFKKEPRWTYIGNCRISSYCYRCNTPNYSYRSGVTGWPCEEWKTCAMNGIAKGTKIYVEDYGYFYVNDTGPRYMNGGKWVDLFVDKEDCHIWTHKKVWIIS